MSKTKTLKMLLSLESNSESSSNATKPNNTIGVDCMVASKKRKATINLRSPSKRQKGASEPTEVTVEAVMAKGIKRKAKTESEIPQKRPRTHINITGTNELSKLSVEDVDKTEFSPSSSDPSTSRQTDGDSSEAVTTSRAHFEAMYLQLEKLGEGGFGSVYAGKRRTDNLPVAIKHIPRADVKNQRIVYNGNAYMVPTEVLLMMRVAGGPESVGKSAAVSLLDWYDLDEEVVLIMERPMPSVDLYTYLNDNHGPLEEDQAKNIMKQLVEAAIQMHSKGVFHRDIKSENILIQTGSDVPQVRVIDFGCGCFVKRRPFRRFSGTSAYAPPEFYIDGAYQAGTTTVWQLGALLYEMLDGYKHFSTSKFLRKKAKFIRKLRYLKVSQECEDLLKMCLVVNPNERATLEQMQLHPWFT